MDVSFTNAGDYSKGGRNNRLLSVDNKAGTSAIDTARRNLSKELRKQGISDSDADNYGQRFSTDDRIRTLYMPILAAVIVNFHSHPNENNIQMLTRLGSNGLDKAVTPFITGPKKNIKNITDDEREDRKRKLKHTFIRYSALAWGILESGQY